MQKKRKSLGKRDPGGEERGGVVGTETILHETRMAQK